MNAPRARFFNARIAASATSSSITHGCGGAPGSGSVLNVSARPSACSIRAPAKIPGRSRANDVSGYAASSSSRCASTSNFVAAYVSEL